MESRDREDLVFLSVSRPKRSEISYCTPELYFGFPTIQIDSNTRIHHPAAGVRFPFMFHETSLNRQNLHSVQYLGDFKGKSTPAFGSRKRFVVLSVQEGLL